ncbi:MAG: hypothetical protein RIB98_13815 [Acidimicrobiales bacterium]
MKVIDAKLGFGLATSVERESFSAILPGRVTGSRCSQERRDRAVQVAGEDDGLEQEGGE